MGYGTPCWLFIGSQNGRGYGKVSTPDAARPKAQLVHRVVWTAAYGSIPAGMQLDHLCNVTTCVNIAHLEPVTGLENNRRAQLRRLGGVLSWLQADEHRFFRADAGPSPVRDSGPGPHSLTA